MPMPSPLTRKLTIIAQDPSVRLGRRILRSAIDVPAEVLAAGPWGHRVHVIDYDASRDVMLEPGAYADGADPFAEVSDAELLASPAFHAQNVYAIVMSVLARFEFALGRRVAWSFRGHQIKIAPHAFADANAFYSETDEALLFGYFPSRSGRGTVFTCLSHDVVAHEATHALLDGLRTRYTDPSSPDQAAFHEGFADVVAILGVFAQRSVVGALLGNGRADAGGRIARRRVSIDALQDSVLLGLAEQMGHELQAVRGDALRRSVRIPPAKDRLSEPEFLEPHRRGEVFVAALLNAFLRVWSRRLESLGEVGRGEFDLGRVVEEGAEIADHLLTVVIRAIDYAPVVDLQFGDFLSALLTADAELHPDDDKYAFRAVVPACFAAYGILPAANATSTGTWDPPPAAEPLVYHRNHFEPLRHDPDEVFRFIWENRAALRVYPGAYCRVLSVRPCRRQGPDGFFLHETVAEYVEILRLRASELGGVTVGDRNGNGLRRATALRAPESMAKDQEVTLYGGGVLLFDEFGRLKFHVKSRIDSPKQQTRLDHLWRAGFFDTGSQGMRRFAAMHLVRATPVTSASAFASSGGRRARA